MIKQSRLPFASHQGATTWLEGRAFWIRAGWV